MKFNLLTLALYFSLFCLMGCAPKHEAVMPFYNFAYASNRLLPVAVSDADFELRIWINNSTSVERVISVSKSKDFGDQSNLTEIGILYHSRKAKYFYKSAKITPKSGLNNFIAKVDSLKLSTYENQKPEDFQVVLHQPFSLYVVEIKENGQYHCFRFNTNFPSKKVRSTKYTDLQNLIFSEFNYHFYMKTKD